MAESVTLNQRIADRLVRRQLLAGRVEAGLRREVLRQLALLEAEIVASVKSNDPTEFALLVRRRHEVQELMDREIDPLIQTRYAALAALLDAALVRFARQEAGAVQEIVNSTAEEEVIADVPSDRQLRVGVTQSLFPSASKPTDLSTTGADWWERAALSLSQRLRDQLTVSVSLEESLTQLTQRVRGTSNNGFQDGLMGKVRQDSTRILTTQVTNTMGETHALVAAQNAERLVLQHVSIRDTKTSSICIARDGKRFDPVTHEPIGHSIPYLSGVPYHPSCRSDIVSVLADGGPIQRESMAQWLRRQGTAVQDELLGPTRAKLFRSATLTPTDLVNALGKPLTLEELGV